MILEQIKEGGLGSDLVFEAATGTGATANTVRLSNFVNFVYTMRHGYKCAELLAQNFEQVELIE